jgi:nicotinamide-nucleotide amidase
MAEAVARLTGATHACAVTGVGGPDTQDGQPVGTVWIATHTAGESTTVTRLCLAGDPATICRDATRHCLAALLDALRPS